MRCIHPIAASSVSSQSKSGSNTGGFRVRSLRGLAELNEQNQFSSSKHVLIRFGLRLSLLALIAIFANANPSNALLNMFGAAVVLSAIFAALWREPVLGPALTHWDESVMYGVLYALVNAFTV
jgi:hypothetical protein